MARNTSQNRDIERARRADVTEEHVLEICDDIGTCWRELGIRLKLPTAILENINVDHRLCHEKAREMLNKWRNGEGSSATVGSLADALEKIRNRRVAQKLLDFQQNARDEVPRDDARNTRSRTGNADGSQGNASGVHYGNITISGPNSNVNFGHQQNIGELHVTKK